MDRRTTTTSPSAAQEDWRGDNSKPPPSYASRPVGTVSALIASVREFGDRLLTLLMLEGKRAGLSLAFMVGFAVAASVLVITGWLALIACVVLALVLNGIEGWPWALFIAALLSFAGAAGLVVLLMGRSKDRCLRRLVASSRQQAPTPDHG